jgi:hypothetical protein
LGGTVNLGVTDGLCRSAEFLGLFQRLSKIRASFFALLQGGIIGFELDPNRFKAEAITRILEFAVNLIYRFPTPAIGTKNTC